MKKCKHLIKEVRAGKVSYLNEKGDYHNKQGPAVIFYSKLGYFSNIYYKTNGCPSEKLNHIFFALGKVVSATWGFNGINYLVEKIYYDDASIKFITINNRQQRYYPKGKHFDNILLEIEKIKIWE